MQLYNHIARNIRYPSHINIIFNEIVNHFNIKNIESTEIIVVGKSSLNYVKWEGYNAIGPMYKPLNYFPADYSIENVELEQLFFMDKDTQINVGMIRAVYIEEFNKLYIMEN